MRLILAQERARLYARIIQSRPLAANFHVEWLADKCFTSTIWPIKMMAAARPRHENDDFGGAIGCLTASPWLTFVMPRGILRTI